MKVLHYAAVYVIPFLLLLAGNFLLQAVAQKMNLGASRALAHAALGIFIAGGIFLVIRNSLAALQLEPIRFGGFPSLVCGLVVGLGVSAASGIAFAFLRGYPLNFAELFSDLHVSVLGNIYPALCEEIVFRGGIVGATAQMAGTAAGLASGSVPFGVLHIFGGLFGQTVTVAQVIGISLAGLMLSLVYMRFGIWGAFGCHLAWNSFVGGWVRAYGAENRAAVMSALEGAWTTCLVLAAVSVTLLAFQWWLR